MLRLLPLVALIGCASGRHAQTFLKKGYRFEGARALSVGGRDDDVVAFREALGRHGISIAQGRYALEISGICEGHFLAKQMGNSYTGVPDPKELQVEVLDGSNSERVFAAHLDNTDDCPNAFFEEVARALDRDWAPASQGDVDQAFNQP